MPGVGVDGVAGTAAATGTGVIGTGGATDWLSDSLGNCSYCMFWDVDGVAGGRGADRCGNGGVAVNRDKIEQVHDRCNTSPE